MSASRSPFAHIEQAPPDPILGLTEAFNADPNPARVNLAVGVYLDNAGKVPVLRSVRAAALKWLEQENTKTYLPIDGLATYNKAIQALLFGPGSPVIESGRALTIQSIGGTGALRVGADFIKKHLQGAPVAISTPSWENHRGVFEAAGLTVLTYPYYNPETHSADFSDMMAGLEALPQGAVVVLHACCHNPTGVDLTHDQWREVADLAGKRGLVPFLDFAYQGLGEGLEPDSFAVRLFGETGVPCLISSSFSKNFSLYRERVGGLTIVTADAAEVKRTLSQVKRVIRTNYSNPASHGAQAVAAVLADDQLRAQWIDELSEIRDRILQMRVLFVRTLHEKGVSRDFSYLARQKGMFSFLGIPVEAVHRLRSEYSIYALDSSRVCVAAMNESNMERICDAIAAVL